MSDKGERDKPARTEISNEALSEITKIKTQPDDVLDSSAKEETATTMSKPKMSNSKMSNPTTSDSEEIKTHQDVAKEIFIGSNPNIQQPGPSMNKNTLTAENNTPDQNLIVQDSCQSLNKTETNKDREISNEDTDEITILQNDNSDAQSERELIPKSRQKSRNTLTEAEKTLLREIALETVTHAELDHLDLSEEREKLLDEKDWTLVGLILTKLLRERFAINQLEVTKGALHFIRKYLSCQYKWAATFHKGMASIRDPYDDFPLALIRAHNCSIKAECETGGLGSLCGPERGLRQLQKPFREQTKASDEKTDMIRKEVNGSIIRPDKINGIGICITKIHNSNSALSTYNEREKAKNSAATTSKDNLKNNDSSQNSNNEIRIEDNEIGQIDILSNVSTSSDDSSDSSVTIELDKSTTSNGSKIATDDESLKGNEGSSNNLSLSFMNFFDKLFNERDLPVNDIPVNPKITSQNKNESVVINQAEKSTKNIIITNACSLSESFNLDILSNDNAALSNRLSNSPPVKQTKTSLFNEAKESPMVVEVQSSSPTSMTPNLPMSLCDLCPKAFKNEHFLSAHKANKHQQEEKFGKGKGEDSSQQPNSSNREVSFDDRAQRNSYEETDCKPNNINQGLSTDSIQQTSNGFCNEGSNQDLITGSASGLEAPCKSVQGTSRDLTLKSTFNDQEEMGEEIQHESDAVTIADLESNASLQHHECPHCKMVHTESLFDHLQKAHPDILKQHFGCQVCRKVFKQRRYLIAHLKLIHLFTTKDLKKLGLISRERRNSGATKSAAVNTAENLQLCETDNNSVDAFHTVSNFIPSDIINSAQLDIKSDVTNNTLTLKNDPSICELALSNSATTNSNSAMSFTNSAEVDDDDINADSNENCSYSDQSYSVIPSISSTSNGLKKRQRAKATNDEVGQSKNKQLRLLCDEDEYPLAKIFSNKNSLKIHNRKHLSLDSQGDIGGDSLTDGILTDTFNDTVVKEEIDEVVINIKNESDLTKLISKEEEKALEIAEKRVLSLQKLESLNLTKNRREPLTAEEWRIFETNFFRILRIEAEKLEFQVDTKYVGYIRNYLSKKYSWARIPFGENQAKINSSIDVDCPTLREILRKKSGKEPDPPSCTEPIQSPFVEDATSITPPFILKLWRLVNDPETNHIISWSCLGDSFLIHEQTAFAQHLLASANHQFNSFVRMLNMYGFRKIVAVASVNIKTENLDVVEFAHPSFMRGCNHLLRNIVKKKVQNLGQKKSSEEISMASSSNQYTTNVQSINRSTNVQSINRSTNVQSINRSTNAPQFLLKLWHMVESPDTDFYISWSENGKSFVIHDQFEFSKTVLAIYYKHGNMSSFVRQLNMYGFKKNYSIEASTVTNEFSHPFFLRGKEELLMQVKRGIKGNKEMCQEVQFVAATKPEEKRGILTGRRDFDTISKSSQKGYVEMVESIKKGTKSQAELKSLVVQHWESTYTIMNTLSPKRRKELFLKGNLPHLRNFELYEAYSAKMLQIPTNGLDCFEYNISEFLAVLPDLVATLKPSSMPDQNLLWKHSSIYAILSLAHLLDESTGFYKTGKNKFESTEQDFLPAKIIDDGDGKFSIKLQGFIFITGLTSEQAGYVYSSLSDVFLFNTSDYTRADLTFQFLRRNILQVKDYSFKGEKYSEISQVFHNLKARHNLMKLKDIKNAIVDNMYNLVPVNFDSLS